MAGMAGDARIQALADALAEREHMHAELEAVLQQYTAAAQTQTRAHQLTAQRACNELERLCQQMQETPVAQFFPKKLGIYRNALLAAKQDLQQHCYPEAAAQASSALLGIRRLQADLYAKQQLFAHTLAAYRAAYDAIAQTFCQPVQRRTIEGRTLLLTPQAIDAWSDGVFQQTMAEVATHAKRLQSIEAEPVQWLRTCGEPDAIAFLGTRTEELAALRTMLAWVVQLAFSACNAYEEIFPLRDRISACLAQQNFQCMGITYADLRGERQLHYRRAQEHVIIRMLPMREGIHVQNDLLLRLHTPHAADILGSTLLMCLHRAQIPIAAEGSEPIAYQRAVLRRQEVEEMLAAWHHHHTKEDVSL